MQQRCPNCGSPVIPGQRFCGGCGAQLSLSCPQCRITVSPGTRFCPNCGATLGGPTQQPGVPSQQPGMPPQQPGWGQQPGMPPQQPGWGQQPWSPPAPKSQSSSSRPFLVLLLFVLLIGMGVLAYLQTPLGGIVKDILGISGTNIGTNNNNTSVDTTKPVISSIIQPTAPDTLGPVSASIGWKTDELSSSQVEYGLPGTYGTLEPPQPADDPSSGQSLGVTDHAVVLEDLQPNTTYHYRVKSKDAAGNVAVSGDQTFTTTSASSS
jgi:hypothetical protein